MNIEELVTAWIAASNNFDTKRYLECYLPDAVLEDPSVGRSFKGNKGIREYFESYFIGYNTQTEIIKLELQDSDAAHLEVAFRGNFPGGYIRGKFDFRFEDGKINTVKADLIH
jgi:ketosteroid isomerase-like protein